jgi:hypothetical protein
VLDLFTPSDQAQLDAEDQDFGSGGVLVLPDQPGSIPHLAVAAGKVGTMFLMNEDDLGGFSPENNNVLGTYSIGQCWCGQSFFVAPSDGAARVVSSGGRKVVVWRLQTLLPAKLQVVAESPAIGGVQSPGFFTTISSNGTSNPIIWALSRAQNASKSPIFLFAFNPESGGSEMTTLFKEPAGNWPNLGSNSNLVPVVANGQVFVASYKQLRIFGLTAAEPKK